ILSRVGANHVIYPEREAGERVAHLVSGRMLDFIRFDDDFVLAKMFPPKFLRGVTLADSGGRSKYQVTIVGVKSPAKPFRYAERNTVVTNHDLIIVSGTDENVERFASLDRWRRRGRSASGSPPLRCRVRTAARSAARAA